MSTGLWECWAKNTDLWIETVCSEKTKTLQIRSLDIRLQLSSIAGFPCGSAGKESACNAGNLDSIPGLGRSSGEGKCYPLQYSGLENSMNCIVHGVAKSQTWLSDFHFQALISEKETSHVGNSMQHALRWVVLEHPPGFFRMGCSTRNLFV